MATILIVDDLSADRKFLLTLLRSRGHRLLEAADGREGLAAARAEHPDLVITDVLMPLMDGYELVRQLRLDATTSRIPVVLSTAYYGEREARVVALANGVDGVLTKPADTAQVLHIVDRVLAGHSETRTPPAAAARDGGIRSRAPSVAHRHQPRAGRGAAGGQRPIASADQYRIGALLRAGPRPAVSAGRAWRRAICSGRPTSRSASSNRTAERCSASLTCGADAPRGAGDVDWIAAGAAVPGIFRTVVAERRTLRGDNPGGDPAGLQLPVLHPEIQTFLVAPIASPAHGLRLDVSRRERGQDLHLGRRAAGRSAVGAGRPHLRDAVVVGGGPEARRTSSNTRCSSASRRRRPCATSATGRSDTWTSAQVILLESRRRRASHPDQPQGLRSAGLDRARIARARLPRHLPAGIGTGSR